MTGPSDIGMAEAIYWLTQNTGFPTFDEFRKNPDKWRIRKDEILSSADGSTITFRKALKKQKYMWKDSFLCDSLEQLERIAKDEGYEVNELEMAPDVTSMTGTTADDLYILVRFWPKAEFKARGGVVANDSNPI